MASLLSPRTNPGGLLGDPVDPIDWRAIAVRVVLGTGYDVRLHKLSTRERDELELAVEEARDTGWSDADSTADRISDAQS